MERMVQLKGKRVIAIGERDGVQGPAIAECAREAGAELLLTKTQCFVWTTAGSMDLDLQREIAEAAQKRPRNEIVVLLGCASKESAWTYAETVTHGDPTYAGPLAGVALELPVYHILEPAIKEAIPREVYQREAEFMESVLEVQAIVQAVEQVRQGKAGLGG